ncbi:MAG: NADH-quinone oxidoreductase subunit NuoF [Blastocatellia bacterium]|nr:NADH-quinone oxidoreductase subunit NuoF [Blastocatellia bacterium]MCS7158510.1 NADH-quinone oxidoreductase subunit NuoF [Blastocatellia bacterium]MDW8167811.1 NADH-quinone oxidoreductase subunit NuoF [Acidobacteriota bacterium]MDW8257553.1 NADH-quinone oxidoreductase subunit NuoF [Acidobacteriota bacterium]
MEKVRVLSARFDLPDSHTIEVYLRTGGYEALRKALTTMTPEDVIEEVKRSALRGRGGAGFSTGMKWDFVPKDSTKPKYVIANADESEPGTCKDRVLMEKDPHAVLEGILLAAYAVDAHLAFIYIRGEYWYLKERLERAIEEARAHGFVGANILGTGFSCDIIVHPGAGAYICGEETALMESLEGKRGYPRIKPPFPAVVGLYGCPTVINNVETLASVPPIILNGGDWFRQLGTEKSGGTRLFAVSGHVARPGVYELPMGYPMKRMIEEDCGGIRGGKRLKAVIPGGSSAPILTAEEVEQCTLDFESLAALKSMLGSGAIIVMDEDTDIAQVVYRITKFYEHESCGWCVPCREGTRWMRKLLERILSGGGRPKDIDLLHQLARNIFGTTHCPLGDAAAWAVYPAVEKFRADFEKYVQAPAVSVPMEVGRVLAV